MHFSHTPSDTILQDSYRVCTQIEDLRVRAQIEGDTCLLCAAQRVCMNRLLSRVRYGPGAASGAKLVGGPVVPSRFFSCVQKTSSELSSFFYVNGSLSHAFPSKQWHCASTLLLAHTLSNSLTNGCEAQHLPPKQSTTCTKHSPTSAACTSGETGWFRGGPPALVPALTYREEKKNAIPTTKPHHGSFVYHGSGSD